MVRTSAKDIFCFETNIVLAWLCSNCRRAFRDNKSSAEKPPLKQFEFQGQFKVRGIAFA